MPRLLVFSKLLSKFRLKLTGLRTALPRLCFILLTSVFCLYFTLLVIVGLNAEYLLKNPPTQKADAALILGNRAYWRGKPNPCLLGRIDEGIALANQGLVNPLVMTGGIDVEDGANEARSMEMFARKKGFKGKILLESRSRTTVENLMLSRPILEAAGIKSIIITSEPYHMWRAKKLIEAGHLGRSINVSYAAANSQCWVNWGIAFKGSLREPLAIVKNYALGYL